MPGNSPRRFPLTPNPSPARGEGRLAPPLGALRSPFSEECVFRATRWLQRSRQPLQWRKVTEEAGRPSPDISRPIVGCHQRSRHMRAVKGLSMEKWMCWASMGVAGFLLLLFLLDLVVRFPFGGLNRLVDVLAVIS